MKTRQQRRQAELKAKAKAENRSKKEFAKILREIDSRIYLNRGNGQLLKIY